MKRIALVLVPLVLIVALWRVAPLRPANVKRMLDPHDNVVFVVIDTLRADHLPFYGYPRDTAPFMSALAANAVVFENAFAGCSSTAPAMASIFTSLYPSQHGIKTGMRATQRLQREEPTLALNRIPQELLTLPELMKASGFKAFGVADNLNIGPEMGFTHAFDAFRTYRYEGAPKVNETVLSYADQLDSRYFLYVHYMDPHAPYHRRQPWFDREHLRADVAAYDSEIRYTDEHLKALFERFGWRDNALVVILSDHGEEFGEHGGHGHGKTLYPETIKVPLLIYHRNLTPRRILDTVHTIDVLPTLAEILSVEPLPYWEGRSLVPYLKHGHGGSERVVFSQLLREPAHPRDSIQAAIDGRWHYIQTEVTPLRHELFDLNTDPHAQHDLASAADQHTRVTNLAHQLEALNAKAPPRPDEHVEITMDEDMVRTLKTLGYID